MNDLLETKMFRLLSEPSRQLTNQEMQSAYGNFMEQVEAVSQSEIDYSEVFRILSITRIELVSIEMLYRYELGEKCPEICLSPKGISPYQF